MGRWPSLSSAPKDSSRFARTSTWSASRRQPLFLTDQKETRYIDCSKVELPYGAQLVADVINRTETAMPQAHCFLATELMLKAQKQAQRVTFKATQPLLRPGFAVRGFEIAFTGGQGDKEDFGRKAQFSLSPSLYASDAASAFDGRPLARIEI